jgi:hypothetical protein
MSGQRSIADMAVDTLAAIQRMDKDIGLDNPERHAIREMKRAAELAVTEGLRVAMAIVHAADSVRAAVEEVQEAQGEGK